MSRQITLNASFLNWKIFMMRRSDPAFVRFSKKVLMRDQYTCQYCQFKSKDYQEVVNIDFDYYNNRLSNMATACCFCAQCFFLDSIGSGGFGGGSLIYLPGMSQERLNALCHVLFYAMAHDVSCSVNAAEVYRSLCARASLVDKLLGTHASQPNVFGRLLVNLDNRGKSKPLREKVLPYLRLLPKQTAFKNQIEKWAKTSMRHFFDEHIESTHSS